MIALAFAPVAYAAGAFAAPDGGAVTAGQAQVSRFGNLTSIRQQSSRAVIDWRSFNVGAGEAVNFVQPDARAATLNRVVGSGEASTILGRITANGSVYLINPNGVLFGAGAQVNVGGLVATTANVSNANFMAGNDRFDAPGNATAKVDNRGTIRVAERGIAALVGRQVSNSGFIVATLGKVALAGGDAFVLDLAGDRLVSLILDPAALEQVRDAQGQPLIARVDNSGNLQANGGRVEFSADTVSRLLDNVINVRGDVRATTVEAVGGVISLRGGSTTDVTLGGVLQPGGRGTRIDVVGRDIAVAAAAQIDLGQGADLQLAASRNLTIDAPLNALRDGSVAGASVAARAGGDLTVTRSIALNDGALSLTAVDGRLTAARDTVLQAGNGAVTLRGGAGISVDGVLTGGAVDISSTTGAVAVTGAIAAPTSAGNAAPVASLSASGARGVTLNGVLANGAVVLRSGSDVALRSASVESRGGNVALQAEGRIASSDAALVAGTGSVTASAGGDINLPAVIAGGDIALTAGGRVGISQSLSNAGAAASRSVGVDAVGDVTLGGAHAGFIRIASRDGGVVSGDLVASGGVGVVAGGGRAGTAAAPLRVSAGDGVGPAGVAGGVSIEGRDGVAIATLVTPGEVRLRSGSGGVSVASAIGGSADSALIGSTPSRAVRIEAAGDVNLSGVRAGSGGITVTGASADSGAASFTVSDQARVVDGLALAGGSLLSDGDVSITSAGTLHAGALVESGGRVNLTSTAGALRVGAAGIRSTASGRGIALFAAGDVQLDGDLQVQGATISVTSSGGAINARVATPGENPAAGDAAIDAGNDAQTSTVVVRADRDVALGSIRAAASVAITSANGNVLLLSPLGGAGTGYTNFASGYQAALRPDVGALAISAPNGSIELNGLNLDGLADPHGAGAGLSVTAGRMVLSNGPIAVNKGDIVLQGGTTQPTDGVYLGNSVFSRGWDSVGSDGARGGAGSAADEKHGYGIRIAGRNLGLFDNNADVADLPGLFTVTLADRGAQVYTDSQAYVVDVNGVRVRDTAGRFSRVVTAGTDPVHANDVSVVTASDATPDNIVLGQPAFRSVAKVEILNNAANFRDSDILVPLTGTASLPKVLIDVSSIGGGILGSVALSRSFIGRQSLQGFAPLLGGLSESPIRVRAAAQKIPSNRGIALKLLAFEAAGDLATEVWYERVAFADTRHFYDPNSNSFQPGEFQSQRVFKALESDGSISSVGQVFTTSVAAMDGTATKPVAGVFKLAVKGDLLLPNGVHCYPDCLATYTLQRMPYPLSEYAWIRNIEVSSGSGTPIDPAFGNDWRLLQFPPPPPPNPPARVDESPARLNLVLQIRFAGAPLLSVAGTAQGAEVRGSLLSPASSEFGGTVATVGSPAAANNIKPLNDLPKWGQSPAGELRLRTTNNPSDTNPIGYLVGNVVVDSSTAGTYGASQRGTRLQLFDGVLETQSGRVTGDSTGAVNYVPGFSGIAPGKNNSTTGFTSVGGRVGSSTGRSGAISAGSASARLVGVAANVGMGPGVGASPAPPSDPGFVARTDTIDRSAQDLVPRAGSIAAARLSDDEGTSVEIGVGPAAQADLGLNGSLAGAAANVFKRGYAVVWSADLPVCAPDDIVQRKAPRRSAVGNAAAPDAPTRDCKPRR